MFSLGSLRRKGLCGPVMWMTLMLWVCSLVLVALVVVPLFGWKIGGLTAAALFGALLLVCLGICSGRSLEDPRKTKNPPSP